MSSLKGQRVVSLRFTHYCLLFCNKRGYDCLSLLFCLYSHTKTPVANGKALFRDEFEGNETIAPHHVPPCICPEFKLAVGSLAPLRILGFVFWRPKSTLLIIRNFSFPSSFVPTKFFSNMIFQNYLKSSIQLSLRGVAIYFRHV